MTDLIAEVPELMLGRHELDNIWPLWGPYRYEPAMVAVQSLNNMMAIIRAAAHAEEMAESWRNYKVGAAVLAYNFEARAFGVTVGANYKPQQGGGPNIHAEQVALAKARRIGFNEVFAIGVRADPEDDDANPRHLPTLPPCGRCKGMLADAPEVSDRTLVLSANLDLRQCEIYSVGELLAYYDDPDSRPRVAPDIPVYSLADDYDEDYYNENQHAAGVYREGTVGAEVCR
jgi:cytidine deaminase